MRFIFLLAFTLVGRNRSRARKLAAGQHATEAGRSDLGH